MVKAKKTPDESSINLDSVLPAIDNKNLDWFENLNSAQKKKFSSWLYMRYTSNVKGDADLARYYLLAVNQRVNKKFSDLKNHTKLQYFLMTTASPGLGTQYHQFLAPPKIGKTNKKQMNLLAKLFPMANDLELEVLAEHNSNQDIENYLVSLGWTDKDIKFALANKDTDEE